MDKLKKNIKINDKEFQEIELPLKIGSSFSTNISDYECIIQFSI